MNREEENSKVEKSETLGLATKSLTGLALLSFLFWPKKRAGAQRVEIKKPANTVARAENQSGRLEKA